MRIKRLPTVLALALGAIAVLVLWWLLGAATPVVHAVPDLSSSKESVERPSLQASAVITVCHGGDCDYANVQDAVDAAPHGAEIRIATGVYTNPDMTIDGWLVNVDKELTLAGGYSTSDWNAADPEANPTILDGEGLGQVLYADTGGITITVSGLTLQRGSGDSVYVRNARLVMRDSAVVSSTTTYRYAIHLYNSDGSQIRNSRIVNNVSYGVRVYSSESVTLEGNAINANGYYGVYVSSYSDDAILNSNVISGNSYGGVNVYYYSDNVTFSGNTISDNGGYGVYFYRYNRNAIFDDNLISGNSGHGVEFSSSYASNNAVFNRNTIAGNGGNGVYLPGSSHRLDNNTIAGNGGDGLYLSGSNHRLDNNIIVRNSGNGLAWGGGSGVLRHNTLSDNNGGAGLRAGSASLVLTNTIVSSHTYGILTVNSSANVQADHTLWHANTHDIGAAGGDTIVTSNDLSGDPGFAGGADPFAAYHLRAHSSAIDTGVETGLITDVDGQRRAPDIGADEFPYVLRLTPDHRATTAPDTVVTYTHILRNSGGLTDTVALTVASSQGWPVQVQPFYAALDSGTAVTVTLTVTVPPGTAGQVDTSVITVTSMSSPSASTTAQDMTAVGLGVQLKPDHSQIVGPGGVMTYTHTLTNTGDAADSFSLVLSSSREWATLLTSSPVSVDAGATTVVRVRVTTPLTAAADLFDTAVVTAASATAPKVVDTAQDITIVAPTAGARHVATTGSDTNSNCSLNAHPCRTVTWAVAQAQGGDVVKLATGVYTNPNMAVEGRLVNVEQELTLAGGYSTSDWSTADPDANPTILDGEGLGQILYADTGGITLTVNGLSLQRGSDNSVYVRNARLVMTDSTVISNTSGSGIYLGDSDGAQVQNSRIANNSGSGVYVGSSESVILRNNSFSGNNSYGVYVSSSGDAILSGNIISDNSSFGVYAYRSNNATLSGNTISANGSYGVYFSRYSHNAAFDDNLITGNNGLGVGFSSSYVNHNAAFNRNTIADNNGDGLLLYGNNHRLDNNIIVRNGGDGVEWVSGRGVLRHNTLSDNDGGAGLRVRSASLMLTNTIVSSHTYGILTTYSSANVQADHTLWHANTYDIGAAGGDTIVTSNDLSGDPGFVGGADPFAAYHLRVHSPAIDAGVETGLTTDVDGQGRAPDIGADEFPYVLRLTPDHQATTTDPETVVTHTHMLRNSGGLTTTVALTVASSQGWTVQVQPSHTILGSGAAITVTLTVTAPAGSEGLADTCVVTAISTLDASVWAVAQDVTAVGLGVSLEPNQEQAVEAGAAVTFTHTLTNIGDVADSFALSLDSSRGWATLLTSSPVNLDAGATATVQVRVTAPQTATAGLFDTIVVAAASAIVPQVVDTAQDIITVSPTAGARHVATTGSDADNSCLLDAHPCRTVNWAVAQALSGDVVKLATGVYTNSNMAVEGRLVNVEQELTLAGGYSTSDWSTADPEANPTILDGEGLGQVLYADTGGITVTVTGLSLQRGSRDSVYVRNARLVMQDSAVISSTGSGYSAVYLYDSDGARVNNSRIANNAGYGVRVYSSESVTLEGNTINANGRYGVDVSSSGDAILSGNSINDNSGYGVYVSSYNDNVTLSGNIITGNNGRGVAFSSYNHNATFSRNTIADNGSDGLFIYGNNHRLDNNVIARNGGDGIEWSSGSGVLRHNTLSENDGGAGLRVGNASLVLTNTIVSSHTYGILTINPSANVQADHTLWHANTHNTGADGGDTIVTSNDLSGDPGFVGGADPFAAYHLRAHSPAIDAGVETGLGTDVDGQGRAPDIGADEFPYVLHLTPDHQATTAPDTVVTHTHVLRNSGALSDTAALTAVSSRGWPVQAQPPSVTLDSGATVTVTLAVTVPPGSAGQVDTTVVTATSTNDPGVSTTAQDVTAVGLGVELKPDRSQVVEPGTVVTYTHTLTNTGDTVDSFTLGLSSSRGWAMLVTSSPVNLDVGGTATVQVRVVAPLAAAAGLADVTIVTATSTIEPQVLATVRDTTSVAPMSGARHAATTGSDVDNSCLSSAHPCRTVNWTVAQAQSGDIVKLATGVYTNPNMTVEGRLVNVEQELTLAGGYSTSDWSTAAPEVNPTILDGEGLGQVLYADTGGVTVTVSGLTLQRGNGNSVYMRDARLIMTDCAVISSTSGSAIYLYNSDGARVWDSRITGNNGYGVHISYDNDDVILYRNTIAGNSNYGVYVQGSSSSITFSHNAIIGNSSRGLYFGTANDVILSANTIADNVGDGAYIRGSGRADNNVIARNGGFGLVWYSGNSVLRHNTLSDNGGAGLRVGSASLVLTNTIVSSNTYGIQTANSSANVQADHAWWYANGSDTDASSGGSIVTANDLYGHPGFVGDIDPFVAYHLDPASMAIDAGVDAGLLVDIDGQARPYDDGYDVGADEYPGVATPPAALEISGPSVGVLQIGYTFTATVNSITATLPITYVWQADGQAPVMHTGNRNDAATFTWHTPGPKTITVAAMNEGGAITSTHVISLAAPQTTSFPFYDGFESGTLEQGWMVILEAQGRVQVRDDVPYSGTHGVLLDDAVSDSAYSTAALILTLDLAGQPDAVLDFWWREFGDENHPQDGVFISDDYGANWRRVFSFNNGPESYRREYVDLGAAAAVNGMAFNDHFEVKFQFYDNHPMPNDGYAIDEIRVAHAVPVESVVISGPTTGIAEEDYTFNAAVGPGTATPLVVYAWQATGQPPVTQTNGLSHDVAFTWPTPGVQVITVTVTNPASTATGTHTITLGEPPIISADPTAFDVSQNTGLVTTRTLLINNDGAGALDFDLTSNIVTVAPVSGTLAGLGQFPISVTFDTTTRPVGFYSGQITITSNDPVTPLLSIPVSLDVVFAAPETPTDPNPQDGQIGARIDQTLTWQASQHADFYDLYLWENGQSKPVTPTVDGLIQPAYDPPGDLPTGTVFHWQVVAQNAAGSTAGAEWTFTTEILPDLKVTAVSAPSVALSGHSAEFSWVIANDGDRSTDPSTWYERVYISTSLTFDPDAAIHLGDVTNPGDLGPGERYTQTASLDLPQGISGDYYVFVWADHSNSLREPDEMDNIGASDIAIAVTLTPPPDLQVTAVSGPANAYAGHSVPVSWTVRNAGSGDTPGSAWHDRVYLSTDTTLDANTDLVLGTVSHSGALAAGEAYTATAMVNLPQVVSAPPSGSDYYLFVTTDIHDDVYEHLWETNNTSDPSEPVHIAPRPPDLAVSKAGWALSNYGYSSDKAAAGYPITFTLTVANSGQLTATNVLVTDTLPAEVTFVSQSSSLPFTQSGNRLLWELGDVQAEEVAVIEIVASILSGTVGAITNQVEATTSSFENDLTNNVAVLATMVEEPRPVLAVSPMGPTLAVMQGASADLVASVSNSGLAAATGIVVTPPSHIPWVTVNAGGLTTLLPGETETITITASVAAAQTPGYYRDFVTMTEAEGSQAFIALTVYATGLQRTLEVTVENDQGARVSGATLQLVKREASVIVTEGVTETYHSNAQGAADSNGVVTLPDLQVGTYDYILTAEDHEMTSGILSIVEGTGAQAETLLLAARAALGVWPGEPAIGVVRGDVSGQTIAIVNNGAAPLTGVTITSPSSLPWVVLGTPGDIPDIAPGASVEFTIFASPPATLPVGIYQDYVVVTADGGQMRQAALTVEVAGDQARDLEVLATDSRGAPLTDGTVTLIEQALSVWSAGGVTTTFNQQFSAALDAGGAALFAGLEPGGYNYVVSSQGYEQESGTLAIQPGAEASTMTVVLVPAPFVYTWEVVPIQQEYAITLTLTYDTQSGEPALLIPPRYWRFSECRLGLGDKIRIYNPTPITLTLSALDVTVPGVNVDVGAYADVIRPGGSILVPVTAAMEDENDLAGGEVRAEFTFAAIEDEFVTFTFNPSSQTSPMLAPGETYQRTYLIEPAVFYSMTLYTLDLTQPTHLSWISLHASQTGPMLWTSETDILVTLVVDTPTWLTEGIYTDTATIRVLGDDGTTREGTLNIEISKLATGLQVHTSFELGPIPYTIKTGESSGIIRTRWVDCDGDEGPSGGGWDWILALGKLLGRLLPDGGGGDDRDKDRYLRPFPSPVPPPLPSGYGHQQVRLMINQYLMLEGEGFHASMTLDNISADPLEAISVDIRLTDLDGVDQTASFTLIPEVPTDLGTVQVNGSTSADWLILPTGLDVVDPAGERFNVQAIIHYTWNGMSYSVETIPEEITVYPAPDLVITYEMPLPDYTCNVFDLRTRITNQGLGAARNLRFRSAQPRITDNTSGLPIGFRIVEAFIDDVPQGPSLDLDLGNLQPGAEMEIMWRLEASRTGRFVEFTSDYRQSNYQDLPLTPLISEIHTVFTPQNCIGIADLELAKQFAPYMYFHWDDIYRPISVTVPVANATLRRESIPPNGDPTLSDLVSDTWNHEDTYIDLEGDGPQDIRNNYLKDVYPVRPLAFTRVYTGTRDQTVIQYWFYYYDNPGSNHHEGDWEMMQVVLDSDGIPEYVVYAQHTWATRRLWKYVEKGDGPEGTHPKVYVARGSHASYFRPFRFWNDTTGEKLMGNGPVPITMLITDTQSPGYDAWLEFPGHWGAKGDWWKLFDDGPEGPSQKGERWSNPWAWGDKRQWDERHILNNIDKFRVDAPSPLDVHVYKLPWMEHVGWKDGQVEEEIPNSEYFDNPLAGISGMRTIILHDVLPPLPPHTFSHYLTVFEYRPAAYQMKTQATLEPITMTLHFPDLQANTIITSTYLLTQSWNISSTGYISVYHDSDLHLLLDIDGDGEFEQDVPPTTLKEAPFDFTAPAPITDLAVLSSTPGATVLTWTAPGDDGHNGTAFAYDIRYYTAPITDTNWVSATLVISPPLPSAAGTTEVFTVTDVSDGTSYFAIQAVDDVLRYSKLSNVVQFEILPSLTKAVTPTGQVENGDLLTYTLVISARPGRQVGLYDPLDHLTFMGFTEPSGSISHVNGVVTGTLTVTPTNLVTVSFVAQVGVSGTAALPVKVTNRACVYPFSGTLGGCAWSNEVSNPTAQTPPADVIIGGPVVGMINTPYTFTAVISPANATLPITYTWKATGQNDAVTMRHALSHTFTYTWDVPGAQAITVTATNAAGAIAGVHTITIMTTPEPPTGVHISGPTAGLIQTDYTFNANVSPITAMQPITYAWQATGQSPVTHTGGLDDAVTFAWDAPGTQIITVTATNAEGVVADTHLVVITTSPEPPTDVSISGPTVGLAQVEHTFSAHVSPITATQPITYVWQASGQLPVTHTGWLSDRVTFSWHTLGAQVITVTAANGAGVVADTHAVLITTLPGPPAGVSISGPTAGLIQVGYPFIATVSPVTITQPITYVWQTTAQTPLTQIGGLSNTALFTWSAPGMQTITVTAANSEGAVTNTHVTFITTSPLSPTGVTIGGPTAGRVRNSYTFSATISPVTATQPITYVWQATGQPLVTHVNWLSDTATFAWSAPGAQAITVTASNTRGAVSATHVITITSYKLYLPLVLRDYRVNHSPHMPSNPLPPDDATGQSLDVNLSWTGGDPDGDSVVYDVYLGTDDGTLGMLICADNVSNSCAPGPLSLETHYHWQVIATDEYSATSVGPVWAFTTTTTVITGWLEVGAGSATGGGISDNDGDSQDPAATIAPDGALYVAWQDKSEGDWEIYVLRWNGVEWGEVGAGSASDGGISNNDGKSEHPSVAIGPDGTLYVAWDDDSSGDTEIYVLRWDGVEWREVGTGSANGGGISDNDGSSRYPSIAVAPDGVPYVAWKDASSEDVEVYLRRWNESEWTEVGTGSASVGGISNNSGKSWYPAVAVALNGAPYVAWHDESGGDAEVYVRRWNGSEWIEVGAGSASGGGISDNSADSWASSITVAPDGTPYVTWHDHSSSVHAEIYVRRWNESSWEAVGNRSASEGGISDNSGDSKQPSVAVAPDGTPYITWYDTSSGNDEIYARRWNGNEWREIGIGSASEGGISGNDGRSKNPVIVISLDGTPYVVWYDDSSEDNEIYMRRWQ